MQIWGAVLTVDTCGLCGGKPPWQQFRCHSGAKASDKASFPVPLSTEINRCLKVITNDRMAPFSIFSGLPIMLVNVGFYSVDITQDDSRMRGLLVGILCL